MFRRYLLRRLLHAVFLLAGISVLSFVLLELAPGDFLGEAKLNPQLSPATVAALRQQYGLNQSLPQKYVRWLGSLADGSLGVSFAYNLPVSTLLWPRARKTLQLTVTALLLSWMIALPLGVVERGWPGRMAGSLRRSRRFRTPRLPDLVLACLALFVAVRAGWFRSNSAVLPVTVLVLATLPILLRHVRSAILDVAGQSYVRAARSHGICGCAVVVPLVASRRRQSAWLPIRTLHRRFDQLISAGGDHPRLAGAGSFVSRSDCGARLLPCDRPRHAVRGLSRRWGTAR